jgi:hypothetical protein
MQGRAISFGIGLGVDCQSYVLKANFSEEVGYYPPFRKLMGIKRLCG